MTTAQRPAASRPGRTTTAPVAPVPFLRLLHVELRKTVGARSGRWLLAVTGLVLVAVLAAKVLTDDPPGSDVRGFVDVTAPPLTLLLPLLAILTATTEWTQRTALTTFTLEPDRTRVVVAKLVAVLVIGLTAVGVALVTAAAGNVVGAAVTGGGAWSYAPADLGTLVLSQVLAVVQAFAFGLLLTNTAAAIVVVYLLTPVWGTVLSLVGSLEGAAPWLDLSSALVPLTSDGPVTGQHWAQITTAVTLWVLLPLALGLVRLLRRDITVD